MSRNDPQASLTGGIPPASEPPPAGDAAVTGVAQGSLGTGTALDDTQEWIVPDELRSRPMPVSSVPPAAAEAPIASPAPSSAPDPVIPAAAPVEPARVAVRPPSTARSATSFAATPRAAGIAAAALLALIAVA